jgi:hypothetical protein
MRAAEVTLRTTVPLQYCAGVLDLQFALTHQIHLMGWSALHQGGLQSCHPRSTRGYAKPPLSETYKGAEFKVSQLHECTDNPINTLSYNALSSFI